MSPKQAISEFEQVCAAAGQVCTGPIATHAPSQAQAITNTQTRGSEGGRWVPSTPRASQSPDKVAILL